MPKKKGKTDAKWRPAQFETFWEFYRTHARKENRAGAMREWDRLKPDDALLETMARALRVQIASAEWRRGIGIPHACRWLKNRRWEDVDPEAASDSDEPEEAYGWE